MASVIAPSQSSSPAQSAIRIVDPLRGDGWNGLLARQPAATVFHSEGWARVLNQSYGHTPCYLSGMAGAQADALLPIMEVNSPLTGRRGVAVPFSDECAALSQGGHDASPLFRHALEIGRERKWKHLEIRGEIPGLAPATPSASFVGHVLDLSVGVEALTAGLESSVRRAIRKAEKSGLRTAMDTSLEAMRGYHALHCVTRRKHGVPPQPFGFFQSIVEHLFQAGQGFIMQAWHGERLVAASVFLHHGGTAIYKFGASDPAHLSLRANDLVMWTAIQWLATQGFKQFSMGRSAAANEGLRRFKRGFGTTEQPIRYHRYDLRRGEFVTGSEEQESWVNRMLQLTPMPFFKMLGRAAYPHLD